MPEITTTPGQTVSFTDHGGDGPAVLMLHSFLMDGSMFAPQVGALGERYRVVTMDERGHGESPTSADFDYWDVARDALAVLDELGVEQAFVAGTSQGGFVGIRVALLAPERVLGLVVMGTSAAVEDPEVATAYRALADGWVANGPADPLIDTVATICLGDYAGAEGWKEQWRQVEGPDFLRILTTLVDRDGVVDRLGELTCPVLVLHGSADGAYPVARAEDIVAGAPHAELLVLVEGGAHFLSLTDAAAVNEAMAQFLDQHAAASPA